MNKRRLLKLADLLKADAENPTGVRFDIQTWGEVTDAADPMSCGTTACAMGLAALSREFEADGLRASIPDRLGGRIRFQFKRWRCDGYEAAQHLFKISHRTAVWLFGPCSYRGLTEGSKGEMKVARRIRRLVAGTVAAR